MNEPERMYIGDVVERTGLTERTLRYYEEQGLVNPSRTESGRRIYGSADLAMLQHIVVLKQGGFALSEIKRLLRAASFDGQEIIAAQIAALEAERSEVEEVLGRLRRAKAEISAGAELDVESLCALIRLGGRKTSTETWKEYFEEACSPEESQHWRSVKLKAAGGDWDSYAQKWQCLSDDIEQALPLDPASDEAQSFLARWSELLTPFANSLDDERKAQVEAVARKTTEGALEPPVKREVWDLIDAARHASKENHAE